MFVKDKYNDATAKYDQTVSINGSPISTLSTGTYIALYLSTNSMLTNIRYPIDSGHALGWGTAIECQVEACGTVPQHKYINTTLIMFAQDPGYIDTLVLNNAEGDLNTSDGGRTWTVDTITIDEFTFT